ncbi:MAG: class I SAM-dependent methyltransferase [Ilumatobacteraceae bacterium]
MELAEYRRMAEVEDTHWWYGSTRALLQQLLADELRPGGTFLDLGAGTGATGAWLAAHGRVVAADFEPLALTLHRERHQASEVVACDAVALPFADDSFDAVLCVTVLCHRSIESPAAAVAEMARVVRPGGVVCLMEPGGRRLRRAHDRVTHTGRRFSRGDLAGLVTESGMRVERSTGAYSFLVPPAVVKMLLERRDTSSDLDANQGGLGGVLPAAARLERSVLRRIPLPAGLSVIAVARAG